MDADANAECRAHLKEEGDAESPFAIDVLRAVRDPVPSIEISVCCAIRLLLIALSHLRDDGSNYNRKLLKHEQRTP